VTVSIKFDSGQGFQLDAIDSVVSIFSGWNSEISDASQFLLEGNAEELFAEKAFGNSWGLTAETLLSNVRKVQSRKRMNSVGESSLIVPEAMALPYNFDGNLEDFSVEMETGTGKTYVYLRTAIELYKNYNISKFVIVVPTVAIREGVVASLSLLRDHFAELYSDVQYDSYVYDSKNMSRLRQFSTTKHLQILVMNIQAFSKDSTLIKRDSENLNGAKPIDLITAVRPVVIMDEPQKLDSKLQKEAIADLDPLVRLRYSATHKDRHCLLFRLSPSDAYEQRLVKRIEVLSMSAEEDLNMAYVEVKRINISGGAKPTATAVINKHGGRKQLPLKVNDDLQEITSMDVYKGWIVEDIHAPNELHSGFVEFQNGRKIRLSGNTDVDLDWWQRAQISTAIQKHFETELKLHQAATMGEIQPMKPLTLFFIDRVANYDPDDAKFKVWFDDLYAEILNSDDGRKFKNLELPEPKESRSGYFATTKGKAKDTKGDSADDSEAYDLIMRDKEKLLSLDNPVRFIFSHSALSEGWDNPNVFTICNLQESQSEIKRRQQIGRGLRLPVMNNGERNRNDRFNVLTVIASETFEKYAAGLQKELQSETGENFSGSIVDARSRRKVSLKPNYRELPGFKELWKKIAPRTRYELNFLTEDLTDEAVIRMKDLGKSDPISAPKIVIRQTALEIRAGNEVTPGASGPIKHKSYKREIVIPDFLKELQRILPVSRATIAKIIKESGRIQEVKINPAQFISHVKKAIEASLANTIVEHQGITYFPLTGEGSAYSAKYFDEREIESYADNIVEVEHSIYDAVVCDSNVEREFAKALDKRPDVELFLKLPDWFKISTPVGGYNPDWAIVRKMETGESRVYLVRETKGTTVVENLRFEGERWKIEFGRRHFDAIAVDYKITSNANQLDADIPFKLESLN
jgi:type III restriction enzyme